jgi:hypothetical protein
MPKPGRNNVPGRGFSRSGGDSCNRFGDIRIVDGVPAPVVPLDDDTYVTLGGTIPPAVYRHDWPTPINALNKNERLALAHAIETWHRQHEELYECIRSECDALRTCPRCRVIFPVPKERRTKRYCSKKCQLAAKVSRYRKRARQKAKQRQEKQDEPYPGAMHR